MKYNFNTPPGERRHPAQDLQADEIDELFELVNHILVNDDGFAVLSGDSEKTPRRFEKIATAHSSAFVARDTVTEFYIKGTYATNALAEYKVMNRLHAMLTEKELGVHAVRVAGTIVPLDDWLPTVNLIEPASGQPLNTIYPPHTLDAKGKRIATDPAPKQMHLITMVNAIDNAIGMEARRALLTDIHGDNVLLDDRGEYTIIDQPRTDCLFAAEYWLNTHSE